MSDHTPGPWTVTIEPPRRDDPGGRVTVSTDQDAGNEYSSLICFVTTYPLHDYAEPTEEMANAHLIAAAPDLLAVCRMALPVVKRYGDPYTHDTLLAAIAKATALEPIGTRTY